MPITDVDLVFLALRVVAGLGEYHATDILIFVVCRSYEYPIQN